MKTAVALVLMLVMLMLSASFSIAEEAESFTGSDEIITITAHDGISFDGRLRLPKDAESVEKLVIYVNSSGPHTYDDRRGDGTVDFRYHDLFAQEFNRRGIAYFSYNTRGCTPGGEAPNYTTIDDEAYQTYLPSNEIKDMVSILDRLKEEYALANAKVYLFGLSAGSVVGPAAVLQENLDVEALLLAGYPNISMADTVQWQLSGGSSMVFYNQCFDTDGSGDVSQEEFEADPYGVGAALSVDFESLDLNGDGTLTADDFHLMLTEWRESVLNAFENGDDAWLKENYPTYVTSAWYQDYKNIAPNAETLPQLDLPIHIFHGLYDQNTNVQGVYDIQAAFEALGKTNLTTHIYPADHDLNYMLYVQTGEVPEPLAEVFDTVAGM